jgi:hypothetical protein
VLLLLVGGVVDITVPVNVGLARGASKAAEDRVSYPGTVGVPVNVGLARGASKAAADVVSYPGTVGVPVNAGEARGASKAAEDRVSYVVAAKPASRTVPDVVPNTTEKVVVPPEELEDKPEPAAILATPVPGQFRVVPDRVHPVPGVMFRKLPDASAPANPADKALSRKAVNDPLPVWSKTVGEPAVGAHVRSPLDAVDKVP